MSYNSYSTYIKLFNIKNVIYDFRFTYGSDLPQIIHKMYIIYIDIKYKSGNHKILGKIASVVTRLLNAYKEQLKLKVSGSKI